MTWLETIAYGSAIWIGLVALVVALARYTAYRRDHAFMLRRLDSHPREAIRNPVDAFRREGRI